MPGSKRCSTINCTALSWNEPFRAIGKGRIRLIPRQSAVSSVSYRARGPHDQTKTQTFCNSNIISQPVSHTLETAYNVRNVPATRATEPQTTRAQIPSTNRLVSHAPKCQSIHKRRIEDHAHAFIRYLSLNGRASCCEWNNKVRNRQ